MTNFVDVDLGGKRYVLRETPEKSVRAFLGGRGLNMLFLARLLRGAGGAEKVDPFGPENPLIFGAGLLTGTIAPNAARFNVSAKSPETLGLGDANCGGFFAAAMRRSGFDRIVIRGCAQEPTYLYLEDGQVHFLPAEDLWGMGSFETQEALKKIHGPGTISAVIGPAGENLVRMAAVMTGKKNTAGRCGMGAVMGSKNLKAIAAKGRGKLQIEDPKKLRQDRIELTKYLKNSKVVQVLGKLGTPFLYQVSNTLGTIRTRNSQDNFFDDTLNAEAVERVGDVRDYDGIMQSMMDNPYVGACGTYNFDPDTHAGFYGLDDIPINYYQMQDGQPNNLAIGAGTDVDMLAAFQVPWWLE